MVFKWAMFISFFTTSFFHLLRFARAPRLLKITNVTGTVISTFGLENNQSIDLGNNTFIYYIILLYYNYKKITTLVKIPLRQKQIALLDFFWEMISYLTWCCSLELPVSSALSKSKQGCLDILMSQRN